MESHIQPWVKVQMSARGVLSRRGFLRLAGGGALGLAGLDWLAQLSRSADELRREGKSCILLWMAGGPSQFESLDPKPGARERFERRLEFLKELEEPLARTGAARLVRDHQTLYGQTGQMVLSPRVPAFDLDREPSRLRDAYGRSAFGQGCLMARRLVE